MGAHVLYDLLNELGKRDKMRRLRSILSLFRNEFNKFNNTRAQNIRFYLSYGIKITLKVRKRAKIRNRYNQEPHPTQDTNVKVTTSQLDITNESLPSR